MGNLQQVFLEIKPPELTENIVKNHLEIIVLSMLSSKPMSGYGIIKEIFERYNVFLSQGTVYPLLYSLKEEGIIQAMLAKGNMRTKIYSYTQEGKLIMEKRIDEFIKAEEYFLNSIKRHVCSRTQ
jgi:DNA-binding PadR family transcriptional regulator